MTITRFVIIAVCAYLLGSLSFAIIVSKVTLGKDIRNYGSGNAGLTNAYRTMGAGKTLFVLLGDIAKGSGGDHDRRGPRRAGRQAGRRHFRDTRAHVPRVFRLPRRQGRARGRGYAAAVRLAHFPDCICTVFRCGVCDTVDLARLDPRRNQFPDHYVPLLP